MWMRVVLWATEKIFEISFSTDSELKSKVDGVVKKAFRAFLLAFPLIEFGALWALEIFDKESRVDFSMVWAAKAGLLIGFLLFLICLVSSFLAAVLCVSKEQRLKDGKRDIHH